MLINFHETNSTSLTIGLEPENWRDFFYFSEETAKIIDYRVQVFELNSSVPVREVNEYEKASSTEEKRISINGLKENTEYRISVVTRVRCSDYASEPSSIRLTTRDGVPLVNPIAESGSFEWLKSGPVPVCSLRVYWAHPPMESVRGLLIATRVQLLEASTMKTTEEQVPVLSSIDVPSNRTEHVFQVKQAYCYNKSEVDLRVHLRSITRSGLNTTLAPTVLYVRPSKTERLRVNSSAINVRCLSTASNASCSSLAAAVLLQSSGSINSSLLSSAVLSRLLLLKGYGTESITCSYARNCNTTYREINSDKMSALLHATCDLEPNQTVAQMQVTRFGVVISWNSSQKIQVPSLGNESLTLYSKVLNDQQSSLQEWNSSIEHIVTNALEMSPLQWSNCATITPYDACPNPPNLTSESIESYNFLERYKAKVRWTSNVPECDNTSNESIPAFFELYYKRTEVSELNVSIPVRVCESTKEAYASVSGFTRVGNPIVAHLSGPDEKPYVQWISELMPSLLSDGSRYRVSLLVRDLSGSRVKRVEFVFQVVGWTRLSAFATMLGAMVAAALLVSLYVGICYGVGRYCHGNKFRISPSKPGDSSPTTSDKNNVYCLYEESEDKFSVHDQEFGHPNEMNRTL